MVVYPFYKLSNKHLWTFGKWGPSGRRRNYNLATTLRYQALYLNCDTFILPIRAETQYLGSKVAKDEKKNPQTTNEQYQTTML